MLLLVYNSTSFGHYFVFHLALLERSSPLSLRKQKADLMKHNFSLLLGNSISYPRSRVNKRSQRWLWFLLAAAVLALTALGFVGA